MSSQTDSTKRTYDTLASGNDERQPTLCDLINDGIPFRPVPRGSIKVPAHTSDHRDIKAGGLDALPFGELDNLPNILRQAGKFGRPSFLLHTLEDSKSRGPYFYATEAKIHTLVEKLFKDVLNMLAYPGKRWMEPEVALTKVKYDGRGSDFLLVLDATRRPIMIVVVQNPCIPDVLQHPQLLGQMWDFMMDVMSFFGQYHIISVSTTFEETRFHWFPHSDDFVASTAPPIQPAGPAPSLDMVQMALERELHSSAVIPHTDENLVPLLLSAVVKCMHSPHGTVPMADPRRACYRITRDGWAWASMTAETISRLTFRMTEEAQQCTGFLVIRSFFRDAERKVWLAVAEPSQQIVVVKILETEVEVEAERDCWQRVNGATAAFCTKLRESWALCAPFIVHATERDGSPVVFNFDIAEWARQYSAEAGPLPPNIAAFSARLQELGGGQDVRDVARRAIERAANAGVVHKDLAWRHIALMPVFGEQDGEQRVLRLEPALLDFGRVEVGVDPSAALQAMQQELAKMIDAFVG
jgi:hypothetical protein